jgi:hypothetical protein
LKNQQTLQIQIRKSSGEVMRRISISILLMCLLVPLVAYAQVKASSAKEIYELQELCRKSSDEWYERTWEGQPLHRVEGNSMMIYYSNHYNRKLNRCLVLEEIVHMSKGEKSPSLRHLNLYDINENNKTYARAVVTGEPDKKKRKLFVTRFGTVCEVEATVCHSWTEWEIMIKPLMEE